MNQYPTPQAGGGGGQRSLEDRVAELERRLGLSGGQLGGMGGGANGGPMGGVGRTAPRGDADCTPNRGRVMIAPRGAQPAPGGQPLPNGQVHGRGTTPDGHSFELYYDGQAPGGGSFQFFGEGPEGGMVQIYGLGGEGWTMQTDEGDEECTGSADEDDGDQADEDDGDELWDDSSADEDDDSGDDDDDEDADDEEDEDEGSDATTTLHLGSGHGGDFALKLDGDALTRWRNAFSAFDSDSWRVFRPTTLNGLTTASNDASAQAGVKLRALIDEMRAEVDSLRSALGDLRNQVERRKQNQDSSLR